MNISQLKYALAVYQEGSFAKAAKKVYCEKSNLSNSIKSLETELGYSIFQRSNLGTKPTMQGEVFLSHAADVLQSLNKIENLKASASYGQVQLRVALPPSSYCAIAITRWIKEISSTAEAYSVHLCETHTEDTISQLFSGTIDIGLIRFSAEQAKQYSELLRREDIQSAQLLEFCNEVLISVNDPLASRVSIDERELDGYTEIVHGGRYDILNYTYEQQRTRRSTRKQIFVHDRSAQIDMLRNIPNSFIWAPPSPKLLLDFTQITQIPCQSSMTVFYDVLIWRKNSGKEQLINNCVQFLQAFVSENFEGATSAK